VLNAIVLASIYCLFSLGLTLSWGTVKVLNLAHGAVFMFSAFVAFEVASRWEVPLVVLFAVAMLSAGALTLLVEVLVFSQIRKRIVEERQAELLMVVGSVGMATILLTVAQVETLNTPFGVSESYPTKDFEIRGLQVSSTQAMVIILGIALTLAIGYWSSRTRTGRALRALAFDPETTGLMGINGPTLMRLTMFVSGALAGVAGLLLMLNLGSLSPESGDQFLIKGFAVIILGGVGSVKGTVVGALALATTETLLQVYTSGSFTAAAGFGMIILVILIRPQGLFPEAQVTRV
jgi:branched-chain amino acid transport system permease protein